MKFKDLAELSRKDAEESIDVEEIKMNYLGLVSKQKETIKSLKSIIKSKFDGDLKSILDMNQEIKYRTEDDITYIQFGDGNISLEVRNETHNGDNYSVKKRITMKRGEKTDFMFIQLSPVFTYGYNPSMPESFVDLISKGGSLDIQQIQDIKREYKIIEKNIDVLSSSLPYKYYVFKNTNIGNGKVNESENLEEMLDRAIALTNMFN